MDPKNYVQGARSKIVESKGGGETLVNPFMQNLQVKGEKNSWGNTHIWKHNYAHMFCYNQHENVILG